MDFRSPLGKIKGLGSSGKSGTGHFLHQRVTALFLLPLSIWFVISTVGLVSSIRDELLPYIISPVNITGLLIFIGCAIYHGYLGMQVVIEDYVHCIFFKRVFMLLLTALCILTLVIGIISMLKLHLHLTIVSAIEVR